MLDQLMPLHWGLVDRTLDIFNVDPQTRIQVPVKGSDIERKIEAGSKVGVVSGGGSARHVGGSGRTRIAGGGGRTCL